MVSLRDLQNQRSAIQIYDPTGRIPQRPQPQAPRPQRPAAAPSNSYEQRRAMLGLKPSGTPEEEDDGNVFGRGLGYVINNPLTRGLLKPLEVLDYGRRAVTLGMEEFAEGITGQELKATEDDTRSNMEKLKDPEYGVGQLLGDLTGNKWVDRAIGLAGDIAFDPISYVGGIGFATKGAAAGGKFARSANMQKVINQARRSGASDEAIDALSKRLAPVGKRGWAKADKEILDQAGVRGGIRMTTNPFSPYRGAQFTFPGSERVTRPLSSLRTGIGEQVGRTRAGRAVQDIRVPNKLPAGVWDDVFRGGEGDLQEALALIDHYQAAKTVGAKFAQPFVRSGDHLEHKTRNLSKETKVAIVDALEDSTRAMPKEGQEFRQLFNDAWQRAVDFGLDIKFRKNYSPHILTRDAIDWRRNPTNSGSITAPTGFFTEALYDPSGVTMARKFAVGDEFTVNGVPIKLEKATINEVNTKFREAGLTFDFFESDPGIIAQKYINMLSDDVGSVVGALDVAKRAGNRGPITVKPKTAAGTPADQVGRITLPGGNTLQEGDLEAFSMRAGLDEPLDENQWMVVLDKDATKDVNMARRLKAARDTKAARAAITETRTRISALLTQAANGVVTYPGAPSLKAMIRERNVTVQNLGKEVAEANDLVKTFSVEKDAVMDRLAWHSGAVRELEQEILPIDILLREIRNSAPREMVSALDAERRILVEMFENATKIGEEARERIALRGSPSRQALEAQLDQRTEALYRSVGLEPPTRSTTPTTGPRVTPGVGTTAVGHRAVAIEEQIAANMERGVGYKGHMAELVKLTGRTEDDIIAELTRRGIVPKAPKPSGIPSRTSVNKAVAQARTEVADEAKQVLDSFDGPLISAENVPTMEQIKAHNAAKNSSRKMDMGDWDEINSEYQKLLATPEGRKIYRILKKKKIITDRTVFQPDDWSMAAGYGSVDEAVVAYFEAAKRFAGAQALDASRRIQPLSREVAERAAIKLGISTDLVSAARRADTWEGAVADLAEGAATTKASRVSEVTEVLGEDSQRVAADIRGLTGIDDAARREFLLEEIQVKLEERGLSMNDYAELYEVDAEDILSGLEAGSRPRTRIEDPVGPASGYSYQTAKGSTYTINPDGSSTRVKAAGAGDITGPSGPQRSFEQVRFLTPDDTTAVHSAQSQGIPFKDESGNLFGIKTDDSALDMQGFLAARRSGASWQEAFEANGGTVTRYRVTDASDVPIIGRHPIEYNLSNNSFHRGDEVSAITPAPTTPAVAVPEPGLSAAEVRLPEGFYWSDVKMGLEEMLGEVVDDASEAFDNIEFIYTMSDDDALRVARETWDLIPDELKESYFPRQDGFGSLRDAIEGQPLRPQTTPERLALDAAPPVAAIGPGPQVSPQAQATSPQAVDNPVLGPQPPERVPSSQLIGQKDVGGYEGVAGWRAERQALINEANSVSGLEGRVRNTTATRNKLMREHGLAPGEIPNTMTAQAAVDRFNQTLANQAQELALAGEIDRAQALTARMLPSGEALLDEYDRLTKLIGDTQDEITRVKAAGPERRAKIADLDKKIEQEATRIQGRVTELPKDRAARAATQQDEILDRLIAREQAGKQAQLEQVPTQGETRLPNVALPSGAAPTQAEALVASWGYKLPSSQTGRASRRNTDIDWARRGFPTGSSQITEGVPDVGRHSYVVPRGTEEYKALLHEQNVLKTKLGNIKKKINLRRRMVRDDARVALARERANTAMKDSGKVREGQIVLPERPGQAPKSLKDFPNWDAATDYWTKQVDELIEAKPILGSPSYALPNQRQKLTAYERIQKEVGEEYGIPALLDEYREALLKEADVNGQLGRKIYEADDPASVAALSKTINESFDQGELSSIARERQAIPDTLRKQAAANQQDKALVERVAARQQELAPKIEELNEPMKEILSNPQAREALSREALDQPEAQRALDVKARKEAEKNASASIAAVAQAQLPKATDDLARAQIDLATIAAGHMDAAKLAGEAKGWLARLSKLNPKDRGALNVEDFMKAILDADPQLRSIDNQAIVYNIMKAEELADQIPGHLAALESAKLSGKGEHLSRAVDVVLQPTYEMMFPEMGALGPIISKDLNRRLQNVKKITNDSRFWRHVDNLTGLFKTYATLTPGFHMRNALSAAFMNASDGVPLTDSVRAARVMSQYGGKNKEGQTAVLDWLEDQKKVILNKETGTSMADALDAVSATGVGGRYREHGVGDRTMALNRANERAYSNWMTYYIGKRPGTFVESSVRLPVAIDTLRRGGTIEDAVNRITRLHFDYSEVSNFDQTMRRLIPFWTFMSRNFPLQIAQMYTNPRAYAKYNSFIRNFKGEPSENEPEYFSKIGAFRFMDTEIRGMPVYLQPDLPHTRLEEELEKASDLLTWENPLRALTDFNPMFTAPAEFATKQDFYTGQRFDDRDYRATGILEKPLQLLGQLTNQTKTGGSGTVLTSEAFLNAARAINPLYDRSVRLAPQATTGANDENAVNRQVESFLRFLGAPVRQLSPQQQQSAAMSRYYDQRDVTSNERWLASQ